MKISTKRLNILSSINNKLIISVFSLILFCSCEHKAKISGRVWDAYLTTVNEMVNDKYQITYEFYPDGTFIEFRKENGKGIIDKTVKREWHLKESKLYITISSDKLMAPLNHEYNINWINNNEFVIENTNSAGDVVSFSRLKAVEQ